MSSSDMHGSRVIYKAPKNIMIEKVDSIPEVDVGEILIQVETCAICGTDIKSYFKGNPRIQPPMTMGHEFCGKIVEMGIGTEGYTIGQRVTMATTIGCGECIYCREGKTNLCKRAEAIGFHYPGAMAPYVKIPAKAVKQKHLIDVGELEADIAALSEPLSCAINGISRMPVAKMKNALVMGLGPLGLLHSVTLREKGVPNVCCVEFSGKRFDLAKQLGFTVLTPDEVEDKYLELSGGEGFDIVIITAPHNGTQSKAPMYARKGGYVSYFASLPVGDEMLSINSRTVHYNELVIFGTSDSTVRHVKEAVKMLRSNPEVYKKLITHILPMGDFHKAMDEISNGNAVKIVLKPS